MLQVVAVSALILLSPPLGYASDPNKCSLCKEIVNGFNKGLEATQGSNFGGGNTKWEEKHLGKYLASETRFVEVTEKFVCRDAQEERKCHMMFEESEPAMEDWWFRHYAEGASPDSLYEYLCIEQVKVCCPRNTFGKHCAACPGFVTVKDATKPELRETTTEACSSRGECDGNGTRQGTGLCKCHVGYQGTDCAICADGYFELPDQQVSVSEQESTTPASPLPTRPTCAACHQSCLNSCRSAGPEGCDQCKAGWQWADASTGCSDINECDTAKCQENEFCNNTPGSYSCTRCHSACSSCFGTSDSHCLSCAAGYRIAEGGSHCSDVDECSDNTSACSSAPDPLATMCKNTPGSYVCECSDGYKKHPETALCTPAAELQEEEAPSRVRSTAAVQGNDLEGSSSHSSKAEPSSLESQRRRAKPSQNARPIDRLVYLCSILLFVVLATLANGGTLKTLGLCALYASFLIYFANQYE